MAVVMTPRLEALLCEPLYTLEEYLDEKNEMPDQRMLTMLYNSGITTIGELLQTPRHELMSIVNFGETYFHRVVSAVQLMGFTSTPNPQGDENDDRYSRSPRSRATSGNGSTTRKHPRKRNR